MKDLKKPHVYLVTSYGADPTGNSDSTDALLAAIADAAKGPSEGFLMENIKDLGGAQVHLEGGKYLISKPLELPQPGIGNFMVRKASFSCKVQRKWSTYKLKWFLFFQSTNIESHP